MTHDQFNVILEERLKKIRSTLATKAEEYATEDRLHNFKRAAHLRETHSSDVLLGMMVKHWVSIEDMSRSVAQRLDISKIDEKIGDAINYLILLEAILKEKIDA